MQVRYTRSCENISSLITFSKTHFLLSWNQSQIEDQINDKNSINSFAYLNDKLVGYIFFNLNKFSNQSHLYQICVDPNLRSSGIGQKLVKESITAMQDFCDSVYLEVETGNVRAIDFYTKLGFEKLNKISSFYSNGSDAYAMHVLLSELAKELKS